MAAENNNKNCTYGIEKFKGSFDKEELGVTITPTKSITDIKNLDALGTYMYLVSKPKGWKLNVLELQTHFNCTKERVYEALSYLIQQGFITRTAIRHKGKFVQHHYKVWLHRLVDSTNKQVDEFEEVRASTESQPLAGKPVSGKPVTGNPDTYKTYNINNIENINKTFVDSPKSTEEKSYFSDELFMAFYKIYPNKQKPHAAYKAFKKHKPDRIFTEMLVNDIKQRMANNWKGRHKSKIPFPSRYLNDREWEGEIYKPEPKDSVGYKYSMNGSGQASHDRYGWN